MELTVQNVYGLLIRSRLLSLDESRAMYTRWQVEAKDAAGNLVKFADWMVDNNYLTEYQAGLLARGFADGFFLNDYKILDRLGQGRMAGVYKAQHQLGQIVAIKVLPPSRAHDPNMLMRFQRESRLAVRLKHPNIVRTFQIGQAGEVHYLVMEYLEGEPLDEVLERRKMFPPAEAVRLIYQALQGLQHIHSQGLVHRDLKPSNLMLVPAAPPPANSTGHSTLKILDIGLGRALFAEEAEETSSLDPSLTGEGVLLGTPDYMAPEQARDARAIDIRADIYSLGCVLYHLLAGRPPFPDSNIISQMIRHATEMAKPLNQFNPAVPDGLQQIVNWMMAKEPTGRYPTPERAAQALQVFLAAGNDNLATPENDPKMRSFLTWLEVSDKNQAGAAAAANKVEEKKPAAPAKLEPSAKPAEAAPRPAAAVAVPQPPPEAKKRPSAAAIPVATPAALPAAPVPDKRAMKATPASAAQEKRRLRKQKRKAAAAAASAAGKPSADTGSVPTIDVDLMPTPVAARATNQFSFAQLTRRDFVFFSLGAGAGAVATSIGFLVALFTKRAVQSPPPANGDGNK